MEVQRSRLLRALVHVVQMVDQPDDLVPFLQQLGRDHRKFGVLSQHYDAVGAALLSAIATFAGENWTPEIEKAWVGAYGIVADAMQQAAAAERGPASWLGRVVEHRRIGWDLAVVTVATDQPVPYQAGQYVSVETPHRPRLWRYLSPPTRRVETGPSSSTSARSRAAGSAARSSRTAGSARPGGSARRWAGWPSRRTPGASC